MKIGLAILSLWLFIDLIVNTESFFPKRFFNQIWRGGFVTVVNYYWFEIIRPKLRGRGILYYLFTIVWLIFLNTIVFYIWVLIGAGLHIFNGLSEYKGAEAFSEQFGAGIFSFFFFGTIKHVYDYRKLKRTEQQLRIEKQEAELNYLKSQTNPHFLFNTLNNIYSLARDKSDLAPESILRLSKILRYMLYETSGKYIAIEQELKIMTDYIALEKLRYDDSLRVNFNYDVEDMKQALPPLLLIPLVENAFKHGVSETRNRPFVDIHLSVNNRILQLSVKNSTEEFQQEPVVKENIGLANLRRQLELLYKDYSLTVKHGDAVFFSTLKINLATHV